MVLGSERRACLQKRPHAVGVAPPARSDEGSQAIRIDSLFVCPQGQQTLDASALAVRSSTVQGGVASLGRGRRVAPEASVRC